MNESEIPHGFSQQYAEGHIHYVCCRCNEARCSGVFGAWGEMRFPLGVEQDGRSYCGSCLAKDLMSAVEVLRARDRDMPGKFSVN